MLYNNVSLSENEKRYLKSIENLSKLLVDLEPNIAILTHYDADGLAAGGALIRFLAINNKNFIIRPVTKLNDEILQDFFEISARYYLIIDLGSDIDKIVHIWKQTNQKGQLLIIDHHKILSKKSIDELRDVYVVNPECYNIDGGSSACTSISISLSTYNASGRRDKYLLEIGVVGGYGDMQLQTDITNLNKYFLNEAISSKVIRVIQDFIFFLNRKMPLYKAITWTFIPYIPNFSGREDVGLNILDRAGVSVEKNGRVVTAEDISEREKERLLEVILEYLSSLGVTLSTNDLIGITYELLLEQDDILSTAESFSSTLSALGRLNEDAYGLLLAAGVRNQVLDKAREIVSERRKIISKYLSEALNRVKLYNDIIAIVDFRNTDFNPKFTGSISTILSKTPEFSNKVIIVLCSDEGLIKISARTSKDLVNQGVNLAVIMKELAENLGGSGGGHSVAAGASISRNANIVEEIVKRIKTHLRK